MGIDDTQQIPGSRTQEFPRVTAIKQTRRVVVSVVGGALIVAGLLLIWLPGPFTIPLVLLGLIVLSWEFKWAKRYLFEMRRRVKKLRNRAKR